MEETSKDYLTRAMGKFNQKQKRGTGTVSTVPVKRKQHEWDEQLVFCKYIKAKYPNLIYRSDLSSAGAKSKFMQGLIKILHSGSGFPDTQIYEPVGRYCGLMVELKKQAKTQSDSIWKKSGEIKTSEHLFNQADAHHKFRQKGWFVAFAQGANEAIEILEKYLKGEL